MENEKRDYLYTLQSFVRQKQKNSQKIPRIQNIRLIKKYRTTRVTF